MAMFNAPSDWQGETAAGPILGSVKAGYEPVQRPSPTISSIAAKGREPMYPECDQTLIDVFAEPD